jgi:hypothetical protein
VESRAGVANPVSLGRLRPGERVADLGCGAGTDSLVVEFTPISIYPFRLNLPVSPAAATEMTAPVAG